MLHRGRLNVLVNLLDYPLDQLCNKIIGNSDFPKEFYTHVDDHPILRGCSITKKFASIIRHKFFDVSMIFFFLNF